MNHLKFCVLMIMLPFGSHSQCSPDSISILTKSESLIELIKPCPEYKGTRNENGTTSFDISKSGSLTFKEIFKEYCSELISGEIKVYNMHFELIQFAKIINHEIKIYETYQNNDRLMSRMNYLHGDSIYALTAWNESNRKYLVEYVSPDSICSTRWSPEGHLWTISKAWNLRKDTTLHLDFRYNNDGTFHSGEFSKGVFKNKFMGTEMIQSFLVSQNGEIIKK